MQAATKIVAQAVGESACAVESAKRAEALASGNVAKASAFVDKASGHITQASALVAKASEALAAGPLSLVAAAVAQRGLGAIGAAAGKLLASESAPILASAKQLSEAVGVAKKVLSATGSLGAAKNLPVVETALIRQQRMALPSALPKASGGSSHLLILSADSGASFYFNLSTAAYSTLKRSSDYHVASQERLTRRPALQAVARGGETMTLPGVIWTVGKPGAGQLNKLRDIGFAQVPVLLTTGYGEVLGRWYLTKVDEEQDGLMSDGAPRKQTFTLEFGRYGDDFTNL